MTEWIEVCRLEQIPPLGARLLPHPNGNISLFRTSDNRVFALADRCPHKNGPLSQGIVHGRSVTCPLHEWVIDLETGKAAEPDIGCTASYPVRIENDVVMIALEHATVT